MDPAVIACYVQVTVGRRGPVSSAPHRKRRGRLCAAGSEVTIGASGIGIFDDDSSMDALAELRDAEDPVDAMREALDAVRHGDYVEYDDACAALVAAAIVSAVKNGTPLGDVGGEEELDEWSWTLDHDSVVALSGAAAAALGRVLSDKCELYELWSENEADFPKWKAGIEAIARSLAPAKKR